MGCRVSEGGARSKRTPCRYVNRLVRPAITLTHKSCRARARGVGPVQSLSYAPCKPAVQPSNAKRTEKKCRGGGGSKVWSPAKPETPQFPTRRKKPPLKGIQQMAGIKGRSGGARKNAGGRRAGAGRPAGSRNRPVLVHGLPTTDCPRVWLLALMNHPGAPLRLRMSAAKALLPYCHPPQVLPRATGAT